MKLVYNERIKLLATALNYMAVATIVTATVAPFVSFLYGLPSVATNGWWLLIGLAWLLVGLALHVVAQLILGRLRR